jgi:hypothetical protein
MQDLVNKSTLTIDSATIINPTSQGFQSVNIQTFSNTGSITAHASVSYLNVNWDEPGGGTLIQLGSSNSFKVQDDATVNVNSYATVINSTAFGDFNLATIHAESLTWQLSGTIDVTYIITAPCHLSKTVNLKGFGGFSVPPNVSYVNTTGGTPTVLNNIIVASMFSNATVEIQFGQTMHFKLFSQGIQIGVGSIPDYSITPGLSYINAQVGLTYSNEQEYNQLMSLLSNYSNSKTSDLVMAEFYTETPISWLEAGLKSISMNTTMPPVAGQFLINITLQDEANLAAGLPVYMYMYNIIDCEVTLTRIIGTFTYEGVTIGNMDQTTIIKIPSKHVIRTPTLTSSADVSTESAAAFSKLVSLFSLKLRCCVL